MKLFLIESCVAIYYNLLGTSDIQMHRG